MDGLAFFCPIIVFGLLVSASATFVIEFELTQIPSIWKSGFALEVFAENDSISVPDGSARQIPVPIWSRVYSKSTIGRGISGTFTIEDSDLNSYIRIEVLRDHRSFFCLREDVIAASRILISRLLKPDAFYFEDTKNAIICNKKFIPTRISMYCRSSSITTYRIGNYSKKVLMLTRGTRGDVQPFLAAAKFLAELHNFHVTICTESSFQKFVEGNSRVARGNIDFVPSGGNTADRIQNTIIAKMFMGASSAAVQAIILSRTELEFFDSEPVMYETAKLLRPDAIIYGFTLTSVATSISEALRIPIVGLILQPTILPSRYHNPIIPIPDYNDEAYSSDLVANLRALTQGISKIRWRRNLQTISSLHDPWEYLMQQKSPIIVPISEHAFGGRPDDWPSEVAMTDFIYLTDANQASLSPELEGFLNVNNSDRILAITFSSMPVTKSTVNDIILSIATKSATKPRIIIIGQSPSANFPSRKSVEEKLDQLRNTKQLIEVTNAPFDVLFPKISAAVIHGGLGTTAEAMRAGLPVIVTGTLLMDQRFWGDRVYALGIGPRMISIDKFASFASSVIDEFFQQDNFTIYKQNAVQLCRQLRSNNDRSLCSNADALISAVNSSRPIDFVDVKNEQVSCVEAMLFLCRATFGLASSAMRFVIHNVAATMAVVHCLFE